MAKDSRALHTRYKRPLEPVRAVGVIQINPLSIMGGVGADYALHIRGHFLLRKDIGFGGWSRKWQFSLTLCSENVLT